MLLFFCRAFESYAIGDFHNAGMAISEFTRAIEINPKFAQTCKNPGCEYYAQPGKRAVSNR
jgi:hypothetical protein